MSESPEQMFPPSDFLERLKTKVDKLLILADETMYFASEYHGSILEFENSRIHVVITSKREEINE